jgi:hypothetical protein
LLATEQQQPGLLLLVLLWALFPAPSKQMCSLCRLGLVAGHLLPFSRTTPAVSAPSGQLVGGIVAGHHHVGLIVSLSQSEPVFDP